MSVYDQHNFAGRVNLAAIYIAAGRDSTRSFDTCFEMYDGDAVAIALMRRVKAKPDGKLAQNIWRYLDKESVETCEAKHGDTKDLKALSERIILEATKETYGEPTIHAGHVLTPFTRGTWQEQWRVEPIGDASSFCNCSDLEHAKRIAEQQHQASTELTPQGEQYVMAGCERNLSPKATQLDLF